jgi:hypothetical protein
MGRYVSRAQRRSSLREHRKLVDYSTELELTSQMSLPLPEAQQMVRRRLRRWPALLLEFCLGLTAILTAAYLLWTLRPAL